MKTPEFAVGQVVEATGSYGGTLTENKKYTVTKYEPEARDETFTWPAYVTVIGDYGQPVTGHTYRFRASVERRIEPFEVGKWHVWEGAAGKVMLSDEDTKTLRSFSSLDDVVNFLWFEDQPAARAINKEFKVENNQSE